MSSVTVERANPRDLPGGLLAACGVLLAIGVFAFLAGLASDPALAWRAFHVNFLYFGSVAQGALVFACALVIIGARWAGPIRNVAAGLAAWAPITFLLCGVGFFGREYIFENWIHGAPHPKEEWLTAGRVYTTDLIILGLLAVLSLRFIKVAFRPAMKDAAASATRAKGLFESWTRDWKGDAEEREASQKKLATLAPIIALLYAFGFGLVGTDQVMSLTPTWFSNIFPWYFAWGGFLSGVAATTLVCVLLRKAPGWDQEVTKPRLHDLGKLVFAFSIFWMYLFFAQYIVIWFGNLPEETQFFQMRLGSQFLQDTWTWRDSRLSEPWVRLSLAAWAGCWIIPFWVLLGQAAKRTAPVLGTVCAFVLVGFWLERNALVWPALSPLDDTVWFQPIPLGIALGFLGAFVGVQLIFTRIFPSLPLPVRD